jgi:hypothetical protein
MALGIISVFMYVNPTTNNAEKMVCFTPFGMTERVGGDWEPTTRDESGVDDLSDHRIYILDWDTDFLPMDAEDDGKEHAAVDLFDQVSLTEADCQQYGKLHLDPANTGGDLEIAAMVEKLNSEGK